MNNSLGEVLTPQTKLGLSKPLICSPSSIYIFWVTIYSYIISNLQESCRNSRRKSCFTQILQLFTFHPIIFTLSLFLPLPASSFPLTPYHVRICCIHVHLPLFVFSLGNLLHNLRRVIKIMMFIQYYYLIHKKIKCCKISQ